jgi:hypothetical protein
MDEEDGRLGPPPGHIIGNGAYSAKYGTRQRDGFQDPGKLKLLIDVTDGRARQPGRVDVLTDASMTSLCSSPPNFWSCAVTRVAFSVSGSRANSMHSHPYPSQGELL